MSIIAEIKKNKMRVFRRLYFKLRVAGGEYDTDWTRIPNTKILKFGSVSYNVDDVMPNFYDFPGMSFSVNNDDGFFSDVSDDKSVFYTAITRYRTLVKMEAGYEDNSGTEYPTSSTLFVGFIGERMPQKNDNVITFEAKHLSTIFQEFPADKIPGLGGAISAGAFVVAVRDYTDSAGTYVFQKYITSGGWYISSAGSSTYNIATSSALQGKTVWEMFRELAAAENNVMYVSREGEFYFQPRSGITSAVSFHFSGIGDDDRSCGHNIMEQIEVNENIDKIYNRIRVKHDESDTLTSYHLRQETWQWGDSSSSFYYGVRTYEYENLWLDSASALTIAESLYTEYRDPKQEVRIKTKFVPQLMVQDRVSLTYKTRRYTGGTLWGYFLWGVGIWGERLGYNIYIDDEEYRITNLTHSIDNMYSEVTMREI